MSLSLSRSTANQLVSKLHNHYNTQWIECYHDNGDLYLDAHHPAMGKVLTVGTKSAPAFCMAIEDLRTLGYTVNVNFDTQIFA